MTIRRKKLSRKVSKRAIPKGVPETGFQPPADIWERLDPHFSGMDADTRYAILREAQNYFQGAYFLGTMPPRAKVRAHLAKIRMAAQALSVATSDDTSYACFLLTEEMKRTTTRVICASRAPIDMPATKGLLLHMDAYTIPRETAGPGFVGFPSIGYVIADLIVACSAVEKSLGKPETRLILPQTMAWDGMIAALARIYGGAGNKVSAANDVDNDVSKPSPFVQFVDALQSCFPPEYRRHEGTTALSKAIQRCLTKSRAGQ